jgi:hypothetical protein
MRNLKHNSIVQLLGFIDTKEVRNIHFRNPLRFFWRLRMRWLRDWIHPLYTTCCMKRVFSEHKSDILNVTGWIPFFFSFLSVLQDLNDMAA